MGITLVLFVFIPKLVAKFNKRNLIIATSTFSLIASALMTFVTFENVYVFAALYNIATIGSSVFVMLVWALVTDCIDYTEYKTGKHYEGTLYSLYSFVRKSRNGSWSSFWKLLFRLGWICIWGKITNTRSCRRRIKNVHTLCQLLHLF